MTIALLLPDVAPSYSLGTHQQVVVNMMLLECRLRSHFGVTQEHFFLTLDRMPLDFQERFVQDMKQESFLLISKPNHL
ncbi:hypothetical protein, partial [Providencia sp. PROV225]|uniref:hypothetical protein n=1 Tax=Providencia sp. PROV225 TaxID=2949918 RepID=UPI00234BC821